MSRATSPALFAGMKMSGRIAKGEERRSREEVEQYGCR